MFYVNVRFLRRGHWVTLQGTRITGVYWYVEGHGEVFRSLELAADFAVAQEGKTKWLTKKQPRRSTAR
jgi:CRP-like cAMP-binding protein